MGRRRSPTKLRLRNECFHADIYKPDGKRTSISFGNTKIEQSRAYLFLMLGGSFRY